MIESFASSSPESITLSTPLVDGSYDFYACNQCNELIDLLNNNISKLCVKPQLYLNQLFNLVFVRYINSATILANAMDSWSTLAEYRISLGSSVGADDTFKR